MSAPEQNSLSAIELAEMTLALRIASGMRNRIEDTFYPIEATEEFKSLSEEDTAKFAEIKNKLMENATKISERRARKAMVDKLLDGIKLEIW